MSNDRELAHIHPSHRNAGLDAEASRAEDPTMASRYHGEDVCIRQASSDSNVLATLKKSVENLQPTDGGN